MMKQEFEELTKLKISYEDYVNIIEPMYMATDMNKTDFVKFILPSAKQLAKKYKEFKAVSNKKVVFISDGHYTPNGCYFVGQWGVLMDIDINIKTGRKILTVRELTEEEQHETGFDWNRSYNIDVWESDFDEIKWVA